jgi:poly(hydroxyalkanoate) granule-associated protein
MPSKPSASKSPSQAPLQDNLKDSAHQIWLAGLGAFNKAQEEGSKMFDALVQEGLSMQRKAQSTAEEKLAEASDKVNTMAQEFSSRATGQWDKLESLFEERVARALDRLGIPSAREVKALSTRLAELEKRSTARTAAGKKAAPAKKAAAKKAAPRKAARKKAG